MLKLAKTSLLTLSLIASSALASDVLVTVNGKNITKQDAQTFVTAQAPQAKFAELKPEEKKMITDRLIEKQLFIELADKEGIASKPEFKRNMDKVLTHHGMRAGLKKAVITGNVKIDRKVDRVINDEIKASKALDFLYKN